jgi:drug/metabolite transporter (DMT)-like permease
LSQPPFPFIARPRLAIFTILAMLAFAGNSLLCRLALKESHIDAATFSAVRITSGALVLWGLVQVERGTRALSGSWISSLALFVYVACFSAAYLSLSAGTGALLLFGTVQATMIAHGLSVGERLDFRQVAGFVVCVAGLFGLVMPGLSAPSPSGSAMMAAAGVAWGIYSIRGKGGSNPLKNTAGNFVRASVPAVLLGTSLYPWARFDVMGLILAVASGALTSGIGYVIWYAALRDLKSTTAAAVQLSVPVLATMGGVAILGEVLTLRLSASSIAILGGIALVVCRRSSPPAPADSARETPSSSPRPGSAARRPRPAVRRRKSHRAPRG